jgi:Uncharacterized protein conserved in bacteria (DUF2125)
MTRMLTSSPAIALVFLASMASADVTAEEVWANWQAMSTAAGQELTVGGTAQTGDTLEVTDVVLTFKDDLGGSASVSFDKLSFKDNGDGTVAVTMPDSYPIAMAFPAGGEGPSSIKLTVSQPDMLITAGGSATETRYEFSAPTAAIKLDELKDEAGKVVDAQGDLVISGFTSNYLVGRDGESTLLDTSFAANSMTLNFAGKERDGSGQGTAVVSFADLSGTTKGQFLGAEMMANMAAALNSGFTMDTDFRFGAMKLGVDGMDEAGPIKMSADATGGGLNLSMNKAQLIYGTSLQGAKFVISSPDIPFPQVEVGFSDSAFNIQMPVSKSDKPQDFAYLTKIVDFTVSEDVWGLFDPAGSLSREPATFILDTKGSGFWNQDIMDPEIDIDTIPNPGELHTFDLTQLLVKAAGAEVSAAGGLTFDNADRVTFQGMPRPEGLINVNIKGVNQLIDNLIALGILTEDDAMGFRFGLAAFARPGAGPDELTSDIEFKEGGVFANGQRLQ